ncbi:Uncharacterised protein [uncultured Clostridium sp.]|uniref:hypothetical protein n=1 Tax=uncultured Clostridium sp. TaxID=59620 RepID=UPI0008219EA9|nr:hypothetical protein [uncultured Clostridium sp.]SCJ99017.1 Uncharacterised protein [uncultured Clostridium sp.]
MQIIDICEEDGTNFKDKYKEDILNYIDIIERYRNLSENDVVGLFKLIKDSLVIYERWSFIKAEIVKELKRGERPDIKKRLDEKCKFLYEVHTDARVFLGLAKKELAVSKEF